MSAIRTPPSIIIADNNEFYRQVLGDFYREIGFEVRVAADGIEALDMVKDRRPHLLLLDLIMPRLDGARLSTFLKGQEEYRTVPIIILSGILADEIDGVEEIRADAYIAKMPLDQIRMTLQEVSQKLIGGAGSSKPILSGFEKMYRREVVLELLAERKSSRVTLDSLSEGIIEISSDLKVLAVNQAVERMLERPRGSLLAMPLHDLFPESRHTIEGLFGDLRRGASMSAGVIRQKDKDFEVKVHRLDRDENEDAVDPGSPGRSVTGGGLRAAVKQAALTNEKVKLETTLETTGFTILMEDISARTRAEGEREQLRARLAQSEKMSALGLFVSGAAHELNNPLTSVLGYAQLLLQNDKAAAVQAELEKIAAGASRCKTILENLMAFARSNRPAKVPLDFNALLMESLAGYRERLLDAGVEVDLELAPGLPETLADPLQILQAFHAILDNALKALTDFPGRRALAITSSAASSRIAIEFDDSGPGIPQEILGKVFEPFFTTRQVGQGKGLGLSVAYGMVTAHAGRIQARNRPEGGAHVRLEFPIIARHEAGAAPNPRPGTDGLLAVSSERRILIVDDESVVQELLVDILEGSAHHIDTASNGKDGLRRIEEKEYDLIILDLRMPDMSGQQMYEVLSRSRPELLGRLIFITADTLTPDVDQFLKSVGNPCLTKPFAVDAVMARVESVLAASQR